MNIYPSDLVVYKGQIASLGAAEGQHDREESN
jgi:hypothetical protein